MFNSFLKRSVNSHIVKDDRYYSLPIHSQTKGSRKSETPYKMSKATTVTRNATLSTYSFTSKKQPTVIVDKSVNYRKRGFQSQKVKKKSLKKYESTNHRQTKQQKKKVRKGKKQYNKEITQCQTMQTTKFISNRDFYRSSRGSLDSRTTFQFMSKISKIFDLVTFSTKIPMQIETFLSRPLATLREKLKKYGKKDISARLIQFKNSCMQIYQRVSSSEISLFIRLELPQSHRWQVRNNDSNIRRQNERENREKYFQNLRRKQYGQTMQEINRINRIEDRLDTFLEKTFKNRKVYI